MFVPAPHLPRRWRITFLNISDVLCHTDGQMNRFICDRSHRVCSVAHERAPCCRKSVRTETTRELVDIFLIILESLRDVKGILDYFLLGENVRIDSHLLPENNWELRNKFYQQEVFKRKFEQKNKRNLLVLYFIS